MRKTVMICSLLVLLWIGWLAWPLPALYRLAHAVETRNLAVVAELVDFGAVHRSLAEQILDAYNRATGAKLSRNSLVAALAASIADPLVNKITSPEVFSELLRNGTIEITPDQPVETHGLSSAALGNAWQVFLNSERGFDRYWVWFPANRLAAQRFRMEWRLARWKWRVVAVKLPDELLGRLVQELVKERGGG